MVCLAHNLPTHEECREACFLHGKILFGNPQNLQVEPGIVIRIDRLEQTVSRSWKYATLFISSVVIVFQYLNLVLS